MYSLYLKRSLQEDCKKTTKCCLFVSDVEGESQQRRPQVEQLAEDAALGRGGARVGDVGPQRVGVALANLHNSCQL